MHASLIAPYFVRVVATSASGLRSGFLGFAAAGAIAALVVAGFVCACTICAPAASAAAAAAEPLRKPLRVRSSDMWIVPRSVCRSSPFGCICCDCAARRVGTAHHFRKRWAVPTLLRQFRRHGVEILDRLHDVPDQLVP